MCIGLKQSYMDGKCGQKRNSNIMRGRQIDDYLRDSRKLELA